MAVPDELRAWLRVCNGSRGGGQILSDMARAQAPYISWWHRQLPPKLGAKIFLRALLRHASREDHALRIPEVPLRLLLVVSQGQIAKLPESIVGSPTLGGTYQKSVDAPLDGMGLRDLGPLAIDEHAGHHRWLMPAYMRWYFRRSHCDGRRGRGLPG